MSRKGAGRSAPALPPGRGRASPGRASPGRGGRGGAASPGRGAAPPPPAAAQVPLAQIAPPTEKDIQRQKLQDIMDRKVMVWDRMMGTEKEDERRLGLETFKRLSEDEVALASKNLSKDKLKEFIDLKIHYFDQLANARTHDKRIEGLRRFKQVGEDEYNLAKVLGPADSLDDMIKMRDELDKKEQAKKAEEKKKKELQEKAKKHREEMEKRLPKVSVSMTEPNMTPQMLAKQQLLQLADIEKAATDNVAQVAYGMSPHEVIAQQQHLLAAAAQMPAMIAPLSPMIPMSPLPPMTPPMSPMPPMMPAAFYGPFPPDMPGSQTPGSAFGAVAMDLDNKMRLLSQLETTRRALQSQPVGSRSSMAEEIKANLRKLNHLKMRLIDEILGEGGAPAGDFAEVRTVEHVHKRDGQKSKKDRKIILEFVGPGGKISDLDVGKEHKKKKDGDNKQTLVLEEEFIGAAQSPSLTNTTTCAAHACPAYQQCMAYGCMTSAPVGSVSQTMCPNAQYTYSHPQVNYPCAPLDIKPEVLWERKETKAYADKSTLMDPPEALKYMDAAVMSDDQTVVKEEYKRYTCEEPVYENAVSPPPGYQLLKPNYVPVVPIAMLEQGLNYARARPQHEIGISAVPMEDEAAPLPPSCPPVISKTTIVVNRAADEAAPPLPAAPVQVMASPVQVAASPVQVVASPVQVAASPPPAQVAVTPVIARLSRSTSSDRRGKRALHDSMERLARSIDDMYNTLSSPTRSRRRSRSRSYSDDDDGDEDTGGYRSRTTSRMRRRRRYPSRNRSRGFPPDQWPDDELDEDDMDETTFRSRRRRSRADQDELPSLWGWLCRSLCNLTEGYEERMRAEARDMRVLQMGNRIRSLIQNVIRVSREVIEARRAIQQSGLKGEDYTKNIFAAESKLWELIDLEAQLANELALYRQTDLATDDQYFQGLANAEDKIRRLIGVETQLAREIGMWRKSSGKKLPAPSKTTIYTALSRLPSVPSMLGRSSGTRSSSYLLSTSASGTTSGAGSTTATPSSSGSASPRSAASGAAASTSGSASSSAGSKKSAKSKGSSKKKKKRSRSSSKKKRRRRRRHSRRSRHSRRRRKKRRHRHHKHHKHRHHRHKSRSSRHRRKRRRKRKRH